MRKRKYMSKLKGISNNVGRIKKNILVVSIFVLLIIMQTGCTAAEPTVPAGVTIRSQLEELDPTSYVEIRNWVNNEMPEFADRLDGVDFTVLASETSGTFIQSGFLDDEFRFVEWYFDLDVRGLEINLIYLTFEELIEKQLSEIDSTSLTEIEEWIKNNENNNELEIRITIVDTDENIMHHFDIQDGRDFFTEWNFTIDRNRFSDAYTVNFEYVLTMVQTVSLGETFVLAGMQFAFEDNVIGRRIDNYWALDDGLPYLAVPVKVENVSDEDINFFPFRIAEFGPDGTELDRFFGGGFYTILLTHDLRPGETNEGYVFFRYYGDGDYVLNVSSSSLGVPFTVDVLVPVYSVNIPEIVDRYNRDVPTPAVVFDLHDITLFDHNLSNDSFFYSVPRESGSGNIHMILRPNDIVRDPEGVITHDSLRIGYDIRDINPEVDFDAVAIMERGSRDIQQGGNPFIIIGDIHATEDRMTAFLHTRRGVGGDFHTRLWVIQMLPDTNEYVIFETWLWTIRETNLEGERRAAIEEFGELTGIDFIGILRGTFEGDENGLDFRFDSDAIPDFGFGDDD